MTKLEVRVRLEQEKARLDQILRQYYTAGKTLQNPAVIAQSKKVDKLHNLYNSFGR